MPFTMKSLALLLPALSLAAPVLDNKVEVALGAPILSNKAATQFEKRQGTGSVTSASGLAFYESDETVGINGKADPSEYVCYSGPASNFPAVDKWISFDGMWNLLVADALVPIGDTEFEIEALHYAIDKISRASQVDPRIIFGVIINESTGKITVGCTDNGVLNCGLMQSHDPTDTSFDSTHPIRSIVDMVRDGTQGTVNGPGLVQLFNDEALTSGNVWNVFRAYNSGSVDYDNLSNPMGATAAYVSNLANFLTGWNGWGSGPDSCGFA